MDKKEIWQIHQQRESSSLHTLSTQRFTTNSSQPKRRDAFLWSSLHPEQPFSDLKLQVMQLCSVGRNQEKLPFP